MGASSSRGFDRGVDRGKDPDSDKGGSRLNPMAAVGGMLGGLTSKIRSGGKEDDQQKSTARDAGRPGSNVPKSGGTRAPFNRGGRDQSQSTEPASRGRSSFGQTITDRSQKGDADSSGGIAGGFRRLFQRGGDKDTASQRSQPRRARTSKAPKVAGEGLSLDNKLDILGVGLVFGALVLFFSALSAEQAAITGVHNFIGQVFGWGALAVPILMFVFGGWLIVRHFGDEAPTLDPLRMIGLLTGYVCLLVLFQFIEALNYPPIPDVSLLRSFVEISYQAHSGGGLIGAQIYVWLVVNFTEIGGFFFLLFGFVVSLMFFTRLSASELAIFVISIWRSFQTALQRRAQRRRAAAQLRAQQTAGTTISVSKPAPPELKPGTAGVLPAPIQASLPIEEREILIRRGGQAVSTPGGEPIPVAAAAAMPQPEPASNGGGGFFSRFRRKQPVEVETTTPAAPAASVDSGSGLGSKLVGGVAGIAGGLFSRKQDDATETPGQQPVPQPQPTAFTASAASADTPSPASVDKPLQPALPFAPASTTSAPTQQPTGETRLRDLMSPQPTGASPTPEKPQPTTPQITQPAASVSPTPAQPAPTPRPAASFTPAQPAASTPSPSIASKLENMQQPSQAPAASTGARQSVFSAGAASAPPKPETTEKPSDDLMARQNRLNAIRSGQTAPQTPALANNPYPETETGTQIPVDKPAATQAPAPAPAPNVRPEDSTPGIRPAASVTPIADNRQAPAINIGAPKPIMQSTTNPARRSKNWRLPDYRTLLSSGSEQEFDRSTLLARAKIIEDTLSSFGAPGRVVEVNTGPVITQFGVEPDYLTARSGKKNRVKVSSIAALDKDLQLALGAKSIRIEAPVPGKGYVGIEVPNDKPSLVSLRDVMEADTFRRVKSPLAIALGQAVDGSPIAADLTAMPHLLIAGTTGSGKSVCVNAVICSLMAKNTPDQVKFIMVDPKRVELTGYNGSPHLVAPVVVELERIIGVLKWVTREMDERYKQFSNLGARNIEDFNKHLEEGQQQMPYIVVIIDELADLMMLAPEETERTITRIAALARATGIHLVIATQRPSVDIITGLIKANFPARIAFAVAGGVDSRVILDQPGAERLLGSGDMLYLSPDSPAPLRLQGVYVSDMEINNINRYWKRLALEQPETSLNVISAESQPLSAVSSVETQSAHSVLPRGERVRQQAFWDVLSEEEDSDDGGDDDTHEDELYEEAVALIRRLNKASVSLLQRRLRIGYTRAARLIDVMEERGVVGPPTEGSKPRAVLPVKQ